MFFKATKVKKIGAPPMHVPPEPFVVAGRSLDVVYRASTPVERSNSSHWVVCRFASFLYYSFGYPNHEALGAHPLAQFGLDRYEVFEVTNSPLIADFMKRNAIHHRHHDGIFSRDKHWVFTFQDETMDVVGAEPPTFEMIAAVTASDALAKSKSLSQS
jgi:hypothetical protein